MGRKRSPSASGIAANLQRTAERLETLAADRSSPPAERYLYLRYAPFLRELRQRRGFCADLAAVDVTPDDYVSEVRSRLTPLLERYSFPNAPPYASFDWADLLASARLGLLGLAHPHGLRPSTLFDGKRVEVQFVFHGSVAQTAALGDQLPIGKIVSIELPQGLTKKQTRELIVGACRRPLGLFLRRVRPLAKEVLGPSIDVRLLTFTARPSRQEPVRGEPHVVRVYLPDPVYNASLTTNFSVRLPRGRRLSDLLEEIAKRLIPALEDVAAYTSAQGRPPDASNDARWWAMKALDSLPVQDIARRESGDHPDAPDLEETIARALRRLGMRTRTE